jgi:hypothetical protein
MSNRVLWRQTQALATNATNSKAPPIDAAMRRREKTIVELLLGGLS